MSRQISTAAATITALCLAGCGVRAPEPRDLGELFNQAALEAEPAEETRWRKATATRPFAFPRDHGAHNDFRIEWWYYTGNLTAEDGRRFGYQLTFFRTGLNYEPVSSSRWAVRDLYTAHFAVADLTAKRHRFAERNRRAGINEAGAEADRLCVWNGAWRAEQEGETHTLWAASDGFAISLDLTPTKGAVLHGDGGLSQKGPAEGNASYYYTMPRMASVGTVTVEGEQFRVTGESWMDHEFSTSFLEAGQLGWDWFSIQLDNGAELMLYQMRREGGQADDYSSGTYVTTEGEPIHLRREDFVIEPQTTTWRSPETDAEYPQSWRLLVPKLCLELSVASAFGAQEMATGATTGIAYWEGVVDTTGSIDGNKINGRGFVELTGYSGIGLGSLLGD
ncbi:MAG: lipocalin-like domain-containing protein [Planctomycetota bacterium]